MPDAQQWVFNFIRKFSLRHIKVKKGKSWLYAWTLTSPTKNGLAGANQPW